MNKLIRKLGLIVIILLIIVIWNSFHQKVYASTEEAEQLTFLLDQYKDDIGNIEQFRSAVDQIYNDLNSATKVDAELKTKLNADIDKLSKVDGMNPLILNVLDVELRSQVENLTDDTLPQMKEEILVIKQWADAQEVTTPDPEPDPEPIPNPDPTPTPDPTPDPTPSQPNPSDNTTSGTSIPKAGMTSAIIGILLIIITGVAIIAKKKYGNLKDI